MKGHVIDFFKVHCDDECMSKELYCMVTHVKDVHAIKVLKIGKEADYDFFYQ